MWRSHRTCCDCAACGAEHCYANPNCKLTGADATAGGGLEGCAPKTCKDYATGDCPKHGVCEISEEDGLCTTTDPSMPAGCAQDCALCGFAHCYANKACVPVKEEGKSTGSCMTLQDAAALGFKP